jgi:hypothetical protein
MSEYDIRAAILDPRTTDGIATGLSRALVALEERVEGMLSDDLERDGLERARIIVRSLLEALVDGPATPGEPKP